MKNFCQNIHHKILKLKIKYNMNKLQIVRKRKKRKRVAKMENRIKAISTNFLRDPLQGRDPTITIDIQHQLNILGTDFREKLTPVRNQRSIGSCSVFSILAILEMYYNKQLSSMFVYFKSRTLPKHVGGKGVSPENTLGVNARCVLKTLQHSGCCDELDWEYKKDLISVYPSDLACDVACKNKINKFYRVDILSENPNKTLHKIKTILKEEIPISCAFNIPVSIKSENTSKSGMIDYAWLTKYSHAVTLVGFDDNYRRNGQEGCLIFKNSWGTEWGDNGYGYLPYSFVLNKKCYDMWIIYTDKLDMLSHFTLSE